MQHQTISTHGTRSGDKPPRSFPSLAKARSVRSSGSDGQISPTARKATPPFYFGGLSWLPSQLPITALLPKSGVCHCAHKFAQRQAFLCSGATPPHSALVSFISWREVVRFCERDSGAHSALCAFVLPPRSALLSFVSCREVVRFCERSAPSLRGAGTPCHPSFGRGLARSPSGLPAGWVAFHCSGLINYLCCGECPPWLRQPTFVVSLLWA